MGADKQSNLTARRHRAAAEQGQGEWEMAFGASYRILLVPWGKDVAATIAAADPEAAMGAAVVASLAMSAVVDAASAAADVAAATPPGAAASVRRGSVAALA